MAKSPAKDLAAALVAALVPATLPAGSIVAGPEQDPQPEAPALGAVRIWVRVIGSREVRPALGAASKINECDVEALVLSEPQDYDGGEVLALAVRDLLSTVPPAGYFFALAANGVPTDEGKSPAGRWRFPVRLRVQYSE